MKKRIARITKVDTVLNVVDRKLELGFTVQFHDDGETLAINFKEEDEKSWNTFFSLMELYYGYEKLCWFNELQGQDIWILQGESRGIAFSVPYTERWVVNGEGGFLYTEDKAREILASKNQSK